MVTSLNRALLVLAMPVVVMASRALEVGDPAPELSGVEYVKGKAADFSQQWTVVEFWATWCGPCRRSIPHLTKIANEQGDSVAVVAFSKEPKKTVSAFVEKQGEKMAYTVGVIPEAIWKAYMKGQATIPKVFLISPDQTVAWIGHPRDTEAILDQALDGRLDQERLKKLQPLEARLNGVLRSGSADLIAQAADAVLAVEPWHEKALPVRIYAAKMQDDVAAARAAYEAISLGEISVEDAGRIASDMLEDPDLRYRFPRLAAVLVANVAEAQPDSVASLVLQARMQYVLGDVARAMALQERAAAADAKAGEALAYYRAVVALQGK